MIISVEDKFENLYKELKSMGYEVYMFSENVQSDIVIYSGENTRISSLNGINSTSNESGVFIINGDNKSGKEIEHMVKSKVYSSLF